MAGQAGTAFVPISPDLKQFGPELTKGVEGQLSGVQKAVDDKVSKPFADAAKKSTSSLASIEKSLSSVSTGLASFGKKATLFLTVPLAAAGVAMVDLASDAAETENKVDVTFGAMAGEIKAWSSSSIESMGVAQATAQDLASTFGLLFKAAGLPGPEIEDLSEQFSQLAADASSYFNVPVDVALEKLRSGLVGEAEPLRDFGVFLSEAAVQAKAAELGLGGLNGELTEQEKVAARAAIIMEQMSDVQGDFARTSDSTANQIRATQERFKELGAELGQDLLPIANQVLGWASSAAGWFSDLGPAVRGAAIGFGALLIVAGPVATALSAVAAGVRLLLIAGSGLGAQIGVLVTRIGLWTGAATTLGAVLSTGGILAGIGLIVAGVEAWIRVIHEHNAAVASNVSALETQSGAYEELAAAAEEADSKVLSFKAGSPRFTGGMNALSEATQQVVDHIQDLRDRFAGIPGELTHTQNALIDQALANHDYATALEIVTGALDANRAALREARAEWNAHTKAVEGYTDAIAASLDVGQGVLRFEKDELIPTIGEDGVAAFDAQALAIRESTDVFQSYVSTHKGGVALIKGFLEETGQDWATFREQARVAAAGGQEAWDTFAADMVTKWQDVHDQISSTFDFLGPVLSQFLGDAEFTLGDVNKALQGTLDQIHTFGSDFATVAQQGKGDAQAFLDYIVQQGPQAFGLLHEVATAAITDPKAFDDFISNFNEVDAAQQTLADSITTRLIGTLDGLNRTLATLGVVLMGLPGYDATNLPSVEGGFNRLTTAAGLSAMAMGGAHRELGSIPGDGGTNLPSVRGGLSGVTTQAGLAAMALGGTHRELGNIPADGSTHMPSARGGLAGIGAQASTAAGRVNALTSAINGIPASTSANIVVHIQQIMEAQHGFHGWITSPTPFMVAEAGEAEYVDITPASQMAGRSAELARDMPAPSGSTSVPGPATTAGGLTLNVTVQNAFGDWEDIAAQAAGAFERAFRRRDLLGLTSVPRR